MPSPWFILLVSIASRLVYSKRFPFEDLRSEVNYMALIVLFNALWFALCSWVFGDVFGI